MSFPPEITELLATVAGRPWLTTRLAGIGGPGAYLCEGPRRQVVVKVGTAQLEREFYEQVAPRLREHGVGIAELLGSGRSDQGDWI